MKLRKMHWIGVIFGAVILVVGLIFFIYTRDINLFFFLVGISIGVIAFPFVVSIVIENKRGQEISEMFLEFSRNLAESVATGTPISKSIINMRTKNYGSLTPYIKKLANQIELGVPVDMGLQTFADDVDNPVVGRAVALIREAEKAGGEIDFILESVAESISQVEKLKKERRAAIYNLVVEGYIIFFIFISIMLVMEFRILPLTAGIGEFGQIGAFGGDLSEIGTQPGQKFDPQTLSRPLLYLLLAQGLFAGLTIGKLAEGTIRAGVKHSFILMIAAFLISTGARLFFT